MTSARRGARARELATTPALRAIRARRARWTPGLAWRSTWRLLAAAAAFVVLEVDLLVGDLQREGVSGYLRGATPDEQLQLALIAWTILAVPAACGVHVLRVLRSRAREVPPARRHRGIPGIGAALVATWWVAPFWALCIESRANNDGPESVLLVDALAIVLLVVGIITPRLRSVVELDDERIEWRGPPGAFVPDARPDTDVGAYGWDAALMRTTFRIVGATTWIMAWTVGGPFAALGLAIVWAGWHVHRSRRLVRERWPWREVRIAAVDGGSPALVVRAGMLDLAPMLGATSRNESIVWTIAERSVRAGDGVTGVDDELRRIARDAAARQRRGAASRLELRPTARHAIRGRLAPVPSLVVAALLVVWFGVRARSGDVEAALIFAGIVLSLVVVGSWLAARARRLRIEVAPPDVVLAGVTRTRRIPVDRIAAMLLLPLLPHPYPAQQRIDVDGMLVDRDANQLARLRGGDWSPAQLERLAEALGVEVTTIAEPLPISTVVHAFPGYAAMWERDPTKLGVLIALGIIGAAAAVILALELA